MLDDDAGDSDAGEPGPLDARTVMRLATNYLARYAASSQRLRRVLERQIRRWHERRRLPRPEPADVAALIETTVSRLIELRLVDDDGFALARARSLVAKGLPGGRIRRRLAADGLDPRTEGIDDVIVADADAQARRYAARKRLGPFRAGARAPYRDKDIRSLIRAGFPPRAAIAIIDGPAADAEDGDPSP